MSEIVVEEDPEPLSGDRSWLDKNYGLRDDVYLGMVEFYRQRQSPEERRSDVITHERMAAERERLVDEIWPIGRLPGHRDKTSKQVEAISVQRRTIGRVLIQRFFTNSSISQ